MISNEPVLGTLMITKQLNRALDVVQLLILKEEILSERNMVADAELNLKYAGLFDKNSDYNGMLGHAVLDLVKKFAKQGHSGMSAEMTTELFNKLVKGHALTGQYWDEKAEELVQFYRANNETTKAPKASPENEQYFLKLCLGERPRSSRLIK